MATTESNVNNVTALMNRTFFSNFHKRALIHISVDFYVSFHVFTSYYIVPIVCVLGIVGNSIGLSVLWTECRRYTQSTYQYMFALMVYDNGLLLTGLLQSITMILQHVDRKLANMLYMHFLVVGLYVDFVVFHCSSVLLIIMSVERLNAIIRPLIVKQSWLSEYPKQIIFSASMAIVVTMLPFPFCYEVVQIHQDSSSSYLLIMKPSFARFHEKYLFIETLINTSYPIVLLVINSAILIAYNKTMKRRKSLMSSSFFKGGHQMKVTVLILWTSVMYILHSWPKIFLQTLVFMDSDYDFDGVFRFTYFFFSFTGDILARVNAANDFFIYFMNSSRYRRMLFRMICKCCVSKKRTRSLSYIDRRSNSCNKSCASYASSYASEVQIPLKDTLK